MFYQFYNTSIDLLLNHFTSLDLILAFIIFIIFDADNFDILSDDHEDVENLYDSSDNIEKVIRNHV